MAKIVFKELTSKQNVLFFRSALSEKIAPNHPVRIVNSVVNALDVAVCFRHIKEEAPATIPYDAQDFYFMPT